SIKNEIVTVVVFIHPRAALQMFVRQMPNTKYSRNIHWRCSDHCRRLRCGFASIQPVDQYQMSLRHLFGKSGQLSSRIRPSAGSRRVIA
ncbi:hypothetical protein ABTO19_19095, partial [Acinetobacter baumannii]